MFAKSWGDVLSRGPYRLIKTLWVRLNKGTNSWLVNALGWFVN